MQFNFAEHIAGYDDLWFLGDNFMASTYRCCFKKNKENFYVKDTFEIYPFCQSKYENTDSNIF